MTDMREAVARVIVTKYKEYWPGSWPAKPEALGLAEAALSLMQPEIDRRVAEERAKLLERLRDELCRDAYMIGYWDGVEDTLDGRQHKDNASEGYQKLVGQLSCARPI